MSDRLPPRDPPPGKARTFAEIFCEREDLPAAEWPAVLFRRTLYAHARWLAPLVRWLNPRHFLADHEFIEDVGHLRCLEDFSLARGSYVEHPSNWGGLRRKLRIRVSARRVFLIVRQAFAPPGQVLPPPGTKRHTFEPFGRGD